MTVHTSDAFVRWQSVTRQHFTFTSGLILGLSTGLLAFFAERALSDACGNLALLIGGVITLASLSLSIAIGLLCSINRLRDFRATAQIARKRVNGESVSSNERLETKILGDRSWRLFLWQLVLFGFGTLSSVVVLVGRALPSSEVCMRIAT